MTIRAKLTTGIITVLVLLLFLGGVSLYTQGKLGRQIDFLDSEATKLQLVADLQLAAYKSIMPGNDYIITGKSGYREEFERWDRSVEGIFSRILDLQQHFSPAEQAAVEKCRPLYQALRDTTFKIFGMDHRDPRQARLMEEMDYQYAEPLLAQLDTLAKGIKESYAKTGREAEELKNLSARLTLAVGGGMSLLLVLGGLSLLSSIIRPLRTVSGMLRDIAGGRGDLTKRLPVMSRDEVGEVCNSFNSFTSQLQEMVKNISSVAGEMTVTAGSVGVSSQQIHDTALQQTVAVEQTATETEKLDAAIRSIASDADSVLSTMSAISTSTQEISATMEQVAEQTQRLDGTAGQTLEEVNSIVESFDLVARNIVTLSARSQEVASSAFQISAVSREISRKSNDQAEVARSVKEDAIGLGLSAINKTKDCMARIRSEMVATTEVMDELGRMSGEISRIVRIINDITDRTKLLALNASILAAQAGEHGKGFGVVAEEVKELAQKATFSTNEITDMVQQIQKRTGLAVTATRRSAEEVDEGVMLSLKAEAALQTIVERTDLSLQNALHMARSAEEQCVGVGQVSDAIQHVSTMVAELTVISEEQRQTSKGILTATGEMRQFIESVMSMTSLQSGEVRRISEMLLRNLESIRLVAQATAEQRQASDAIVRVMENIRLKACANMSLAKSLDERVGEMNSQAQNLSARVGDFVV